MFTNGLKETESSVVEIRDFDESTMRNVIHFLYVNVLPEDATIDIDLLAASDFFGLSSLKEIVEQRLPSALDVGNAVDIMAASFKFNSKSLQTKSINFVRNNIDVIQEFQEWKDFSYRYPEMVMDVMARAFMSE